MTDIVRSKETISPRFGYASEDAASSGTDVLLGYLDYDPLPYEIALRASYAQQVAACCLPTVQWRTGTTMAAPETDPGYERRIF